MCYVSSMRTISQRELRNDNAEVLRGVEDGESYTVTRRGVPVARIGPLSEQDDLRCVRPARTRIDFVHLERVRIDQSTAAVLEDLAGDR